MNEMLVSMTVTWREVAVYALSFAGGGLVLFVGISAGIAKWVIARVLSGLAETNLRLDRMEQHVNERLLGFERRVTRIEAKIGLPTPMPDDGGL